MESGRFHIINYFHDRFETSTLMRKFTALAKITRHNIFYLNMSDIAFDNDIDIIIKHNIARNRPVKRWCETN